MPFYGFSHQQGHLAAVLWSAGQLDLTEQPFLAWHLSGGTTELLYVQPGLNAEKIGGTEDLSAGQLIDRAGKLLGLDFPAGQELDRLAGDFCCRPYPVKLRGLYFSLSGMQNQAVQRQEDPVQTAAFVLETISDTVYRTTRAAKEIYGKLPVVFCGGVSANSRLRDRVEGVYGTPACSTDNALGVAVLTYLRMEQDHG